MSKLYPTMNMNSLCKQGRDYLSNFISTRLLVKRKEFKQFMGTMKIIDSIEFMFVASILRVTFKILKT